MFYVQFKTDLNFIYLYIKSRIFLLIIIKIDITLFNLDRKIKRLDKYTSLLHLIIIIFK